MRRMLVIAAAGFIFGLISAYVSIQIFNSIDVDSDHPMNHWYDSLMVTLVPAAIINHLSLKLDLSNESEETIDQENVLPLMLLNAFGWLLITLFLYFLALLFGFTYRHLKFGERNQHAR